MSNPEYDFKCLKFTPYEKNFLIGFIDLYVPLWKVEILGCGVYNKNGSRWVSLPNKPREAADGTEKFSPIMRFPDFELAKHFGKKALDAFDAFTNNKFSVTKKECD